MMQHSIACSIVKACMQNLQPDAYVLCTHDRAGHCVCLMGQECVWKYLQTLPTSMHLVWCSTAAVNARAACAACNVPGGI